MRQLRDGPPGHVVQHWHFLSNIIKRQVQTRLFDFKSMSIPLGDKLGHSSIWFWSRGVRVCVKIRLGSHSVVKGRLCKDAKFGARHSAGR